MSRTRTDRVRRNTLVALVTLSIVAFIAGCVIPASPSAPTSRPASPLAATFAAHGGLATWNAQRGMTYELDGFPLSPQVAKPNTSTVDLRTRQNRIVGEEFTVGFDGRNAWSTPTKDAAGLPTRFFTLGSFYFIGMPFVFADPGVYVETDGTQEFRGKTYLAYRVTFANEVGHTAEDSYQLFVDPDTDRLHMIHHSVTELDRSLRVVWVFDEYQEVDGLLIARKLTYYPAWNDGDLEGDGAVTIIRDLDFSTDAPDPSLYAVPSNDAQNQR